MIPSVRIGLSAAASWAWGTSLIVGMGIAQQKGLDVWLIWAVANTLTLSFFGELTKRGVLGRHVFDKPYIKWIAILIQAFCLVIQMNIINMVLVQISVDPSTAYTIASLIGIAFTLLMYRHGLKTSIATDVWQFGVCIVSILTILGIGLVCDVGTVTYPESTTSDILWGCWSACILLSGLIGDVQHWQRAEVAGKSNAYHWGALFFGIYMVLILAMSSFEFNFVMNIILLVAVLCVTTSTIDSIAVAMHEVSNKKIGTLVAIFICIFWGVFSQIGIIELWSNAGVFRVAFAVLILALALMNLKGFHSSQERGKLP